MDTSKMSVELSIVIPIMNEEEILHKLYYRLKDVLESLKFTYEVIFIDDGSKDSSLSIIKSLSAKDEHIKYISFSRNFGHQIAITAGIVNTVGSSIVIMDGDLQDPPELIPDLYAKLKEGYKVVYAKRKKRKGETLLKLATAKIFYRLLKKITSIEIPIDTGDFRIIDREIAEYLKQMPEQSKFVRGQISWLGLKQTHIEFERDERTTGKPSYTYKKLLHLALDGITSFSDFPLKFTTSIGFAVSFIAFLIILYALYSYFILHRIITGWTSLIISTMFIGGIQLLALGIMGEYISRINNNIRKRPLYIVNDSNITKLNLGPKDLNDKSPD